MRACACLTILALSCPLLGAEVPADELATLKTLVAAQAKALEKLDQKVAALETKLEARAQSCAALEKNTKSLKQTLALIAERLANIVTWIEVANRRLECLDEIAKEVITWKDPPAVRQTKK